ncbi:MAG TPA: hypothetical protein VK988_00265 [Acidimicrobiales bacterium]|nr:hypothetical protein [Acidimicrobiales bacterium]
MNGEPPASGATTGEDAPPMRARPGRVCQEEGCQTRLSIYNDGSFCSVHAPMVTPRTRGKKIA